MYKLKEYDVPSKKFINHNIKRVNRKEAYNMYYNKPFPWKLYCRPLLIMIGLKGKRIEKKFNKIYNTYNYLVECGHWVTWKQITPHHTNYNTEFGAFFNDPYKIKFVCLLCHKKIHRKN